ncbi:MAG: hypothetical protein ACP5OU_03565 [Methanothrix sp.]
MSDFQLHKSFHGLLELVEQRITTERSGHGYYGFFQVIGGNEVEVTNECYWTTAGLHGIKWRHVINKVVQLRGMQKIWLGFLIILIAGVCPVEAIDLVGNWTGSATGYVGVDGAFNLVENDSISLAVAEQNDRLFMGNITYKRDGDEIVEGFAGAIGADNKTFYIAESKGYGFGTIISDNEIELIYLENGETILAAIDRLHRIKA